MADLQITLSESDVNRIAGALAKLLTPAQSPVAGSDRRMLYTEAEAANMLKVHPGTLKRWREHGKVTAQTTRRPIRYTESQIVAIIEWMATREGGNE